ncbi:hypothetical protein CCMA1212_009168 [Trichoderma ghanense]|uniref:Uncharacterized protein n=1 Tax=Trichoderma ghanense TaxID=65468 RepID=A0ABY2GT06_9HYPO
MHKALTSLARLARDHPLGPAMWNGKSKSEGFSEKAEKSRKEVEESWMKPYPLAGHIDVASQLYDPHSVLAYWRKAVLFQNEHADLLVYGGYRTLPGGGGERTRRPTALCKEPPSGESSKAVVALNFSGEERSARGPRPGSLPLGTAAR